MTTTEPVIVGNTLLAPGSHVWKQMDSPANLHIVQISNETTHRVEAVILAIPAYREVITSNNDIHYWETPVGYARAVRSWFRPGESYGQEFPYSTKAVLRLGRLGVRNETKSPLGLPHRIGETRKTQAHAEPVALQGPVGSWAVITGGLPASATNHQAAKQTHLHGGIWERLKNLPLTATLAPLIGLIGAAFLLVFFLTGKRKHLALR
jgi:hypothetical protein